MNNFKKEGFRKGASSFQGKPKFGGGKSFGGGGRGGDRFGGGGGDRELFKATCASCHKSCEVPFRPSGDKPVYCRECFASNGGGDARPAYRSEGRGDFRSDARPSRDERPARREEPRVSVHEHSGEDIKRQIKSLETKVDAILKFLSDQSLAKVGAVAAQKESVEVAPEEVVKKPRKPKAETPAPKKKVAKKKTK
jgi:CxxC-x17-CxxC domain-containing protein